MSSNTSECSGQSASEGSYCSNKHGCNKSRHDAVLNGGDAPVAKTLAGEGANIFKHFQLLSKKTPHGKSCI